MVTPEDRQTSAGTARDANGNTLYFDANSTVSPRSRPNGPGSQPVDLTNGAVHPSGEHNGADVPVAINSFSDKQRAYQRPASPRKGNIPATPEADEAVDASAAAAPSGRKGSTAEETSEHSIYLDRPSKHRKPRALTHAEDQFVARPVTLVARLATLSSKHNWLNWTCALPAVSLLATQACTLHRVQRSEAQM